MVFVSLKALKGKFISIQAKGGGGGYIRGGRGLDRPIYGRLITKSLPYLANKHT